MNPFEAVGELQARKVHERRVAVAKRQKEQDDEHDQYELYRKGERDQLKVLVASTPKLGELLKYLKLMKPESASALVEYVEVSTWMHEADDDLKHACLSCIGTAIMRLRVRCGLPPFDDALSPPLGDEEPTAFQVIRKLLVGV